MTNTPKRKRRPGDIAVEITVDSESGAIKGLVWTDQDDGPPSFVKPKMKKQAGREYIKEVN